MQLRSVSILIALCLVAGKLVVHQYTPVANQKVNPSNCPVTVTSNETPVLFVGQRLLGGALPMCGFGCMRGDDSIRKEGEKLCEEGRYTQAIKLFKKAGQNSAHDILLQLDLGKAYLATRQYGPSIFALSDVRSQCRAFRQRHASPQFEQNADMCIDSPNLWFDSPNPGFDSPTNLYINSPNLCIDSPYIDSFYLDTLPAGSFDTLDFDARRVLEQASLARCSAEGLKPWQAIDPLYKNDRHYQVLAACLALARMYHEQAAYSESAALYQLANENSFGLPPSVVSNAQARGSASQRWNRFAGLALNALGREEKHWYYERLQDECGRLPEDDIRVAATFHAVAAASGDSEERMSMYQRAFDSASSARTDNKHYAANCAYDSALQSYKSGCFNEARDLLQKALAQYEQEQSLAEQAQTHYCLGLVEFVSGKSGLAKDHFLAASGWNRAQNKSSLAEGTIFAPEFLLQQSSLYNAAVLAAEYVPDVADRQFMLDYGEEFPGPDAQAQVGLYFFKLGDYAKAEEYLSQAARSYFPYPDPEQAPSLQGATNGTIGPQQRLDSKFTEAQILTNFFAHQNPPGDHINSRYAESLNGRQITEGHSLSLHYSKYELVVRDLYRKLLLKHHKLAKLALFEFAARKRFNEYGNANSGTVHANVSSYLQALQYKLAEGWYCPIHHQSAQMSVRLTIDDNGKITRMAIDKPSNCSQISSQINQSVMEALLWAPPLPVPPAAWHKSEVIAIFNADLCDSVDHDPTFAIPMHGYRTREYY